MSHLEAVKQGKDFYYDIREECILCGKHGYGDMLLVKIPEMIEICLDCVNQNPDDKSRGWTAYKIGYGMLADDGTFI